MSNDHANFAAERADCRLKVEAAAIQAGADVAPSSPSRIQDELLRLASRYATLTAEHQLLTEAAVLIQRLDHDVAMRNDRARHAEASRERMHDHIRLALLALKAVS